jgi:hypothetical protein
MTDDEKKRFKSLAQKYELQASDFWKSPQGFVIISRRGIEKIQTGLNAYVYYQTVKEFSDIAESKYVIKATGVIMNSDGTEGRAIETYGESSPKNTKGGAQAYPVAMAEKRALSRCILKLSDFYTLEGVYGEDEINE